MYQKVYKSVKNDFAANSNLQKITLKVTTC